MTTSKCNLRCLHCLRSLPEFRATAQATTDMPEAIFQKFERQVLPTLQSLQFGGTNLGEPMMSHSFKEYLRRIAQSGSLREIKIQTNGTLANDEALDLFVDVNVRLMVSLEGVTEKSYQFIRGCRFDRLVAMLQRYRALRKARPESRAELLLSFAVRYETLGELKALVEFGAEVGADRIVVTNYVPIQESHRFQSLYYHRGEANRAFAGAAQHAQELGIKFNAPEPFSIPDFEEKREVTVGDPRELHCCHPWTSVSINERGDVMPCCGATAVMGNLNKQDFAEIWDGGRFRKLRQRVNSSDPPAYCRGCFLRGIDLDNPENQLRTSERFLLSRIGFGGDEISLGSLLRKVQRRIVFRLSQQLLHHPAGKALMPALRSLYNRMK